MHLLPGHSQNPHVLPPKHPNKKKIPNTILQKKKAERQLFIIQVPSKKDSKHLLAAGLDHTQFAGDTF